MPNNTQRRADRRRAARAATRANIEEQFKIQLGKPSRPKPIGIYPGRVLPVVKKPGRKHQWLKGGGWVPAFAQPVLYNTTGYPRCYP